MNLAAFPPPSDRPRLGIALGSGAARGWAHIGVLQALAEAGIEPDVITGTSIGALVGAWYVRGHLQLADGWVRKLTRRDVYSLMDLGFNGGVIGGRRLMELYREALGDIAIEELPRPYAAVATNLATGQEVWLQQGSLIDAMRASVSLPGLFQPVRHGSRWLVDGGLVNPVPVSTCRALGADLVIAVNLNGDLVSRHNGFTEPTAGEKLAEELAEEQSWWERVTSAVEVPFFRKSDEPPTPGFLDVMASSVSIMQDRITRSRLAGDPPDAVLHPRLGHLQLLDFDHAEEAIAEGHACVQRALPLLRHVLGMPPLETPAL